MPDPLSIAASIVGVTVPALHGTRLLLDDLNTIIDAPQAIRNLKDDVASVEMALRSLRAIKDHEWEVLGQTVADQSKTAIRSCGKACDMFRNAIHRWTRHSQEGKLSWQDRVKIGFFKERQIKAMSEHLQSCKATLNSAVGVATLYSSIRNAYVTEEIHKTDSIKEAENSGAITSTNGQLAEVESALREKRLTNSANNQSQNKQDIANKVKQIEEEQAALGCSWKLREELLSKTSKDMIARDTNESQVRSIRVSFGNNNSGFQAGTINGPLSGLSF